jgi:adenylosuccinate lyase
MKGLFETEHRLKTWLRVEREVTRVLAEKGLVDAQGAKIVLESPIRIDIPRMEEIEAETRHDVIAFLTMVSEQMAKEGRAVLHYGLTSTDLVDTAQNLLLGDALHIVTDELHRFLGILKTQALAHRQTLMVGRSHGIHGEPIVFGMKFLSWYAEFERHAARLERAARTMRVGKLSGAMGTAVTLSPEIEEEILAGLGLSVEPVATQVVSRDRHAELFSVFAGIGSSLERIAVEIRHLQRTEVREAEEPFHKGQKGSSAMPHKRNPVGSENITGLARLLRSYVQAALENVALWHERDISHSSVERVILPDGFCLVDYMLDRMGTILRDLVVYPDRMRRNLDQTGGLVYSQSVLLELVRQGMTREDAYRVVQDAAMATNREGGHFRERLLAHPDFPKDRESEGFLDEAFDPARFTHNIEGIYRRVLSTPPDPRKNSRTGAV